MSRNDAEKAMVDVVDQYNQIDKDELPERAREMYDSVGTILAFMLIESEAE